jgi:hypothetical protein
MLIDFKALFDAYIAENQKNWEHDRSTTAGASEVFNCMRQLVLEKRHEEFGATPDPDYEMDWGATHRGDLIENFFFVPALRFALPALLGLTIEYSGDAQKTLKLNRASATPDGLITGIPPGPVTIRCGDIVVDLPKVTTGCISIEFKSIDPRANLEEERAKHHGQVQMGMGILNETTEFKPQFSVILYANASFLSDLKPFVVEFDPGVYAAGKMRAEKVWTFEKITDAPPEGRMHKGCDYCRWRNACGAAILSQWAETKPTSTPEQLAACTPHIMAYMDAKKAAEAAELVFEQAKQALKDAMYAQKTRTLKADNFTVSWQTVRPTMKPSITAMREAGVDLSPYMRETAGYDKVVVLPKKVKA